MSVLRIVFSFLCLLAALSGAEKQKDQIIHFTAKNPCHLDKYKYFCCPVAKIVRRGSTEKQWTDYFYNDRDELIGLRKSNYSGTVHKSTFTAFGGTCSRCGKSMTTFKTWNHNTQPKLAPPKKKK